MSDNVSGNMSESMSDSMDDSMSDIMSHCSWCSKDHRDWECSICDTYDSPGPENPLLCQQCQSWDDFIHVAFCPTRDFEVFHKGMFDKKEVIKKHDQYYDTIQTHLEFQPLNTSSCIACCCIGKIVNDCNSELRHDHVSIWRPFPVRWIEPAHQSSDDQAVVDHGAPGLTEACILPIVLRKNEQDSTTNYICMRLEIELHYETYGKGLRQINRWDRDYFSTTGLKDWLTVCSNNHEGLCKQPMMPLHLPNDFRLIDIHNSAVVRTKEEVEFAALSYQWSTATTCETRDLTLKTSNMNELEQRQSLGPSAVPEVIADSMQLCRDIGIPYLWVDRLCIVQDNDSLKQSQIESMDTIYQLAKVTFIACSDRAGAGLPGTSTRPRQPSQWGTEWCFWNDAQVVTDGVVDNSKWNTRGWTFQERLLSRRIIYFCDNQTYVQCGKQNSDVPEQRSAESHESCRWDHAAGFFKWLKPHPTTLPHGYERSDIGFGLSHYFDLVLAYRTRVLGNRHDILNAFAGLSKIIGFDLSSNMLVGLPERYLSQALLWIHLGSRKHHISEPRLPTWSWAAWHEDQAYLDTHDSTGSYLICGFSGPRDTKSFGTLITTFYCDPHEPGRTGVRPTLEEKIWAGESKTENQMLDNMRNTRDRGLENPWRTVDEVKLWRDCVHNPWTVQEHSNLDTGTRLMAEKHHCLAFNTTMAVLHVQSDGSESRTTEAYISMGLATDDGTFVGQTALMHRDWAKSQFNKATYHVFVIGAGRSESKVLRYRKFAYDEPWGLFVMISPCEGDISSCEGHPYSRLAIGAVSLTAWTAIKPQWMPVLLV